jgi:flagellar basal body-associated protein FliL
MLIGGSPGPGAEGSRKVLLFVLILALSAGIAFLYFWNYASTLCWIPSDLLMQ